MMRQRFFSRQQTYPRLLGGQSFMALAGGVNALLFSGSKRDVHFGGVEFEPAPFVPGAIRTTLAGKPVTTDALIGQAVHKATKANDLEKVVRLLKEGLDLEELSEMVQAENEFRTAAMESERNTSTALLAAAAQGNSKIVKILLEQGKASLHAISTFSGQSALHVASSKGHKEVVVELLNRGAEVDLVTKKKSTALYLAAKGGHDEVASLLAQRGADVQRALHRACRRGNATAVKFLVEKAKGSVEATNRQGWTVLHSACVNAEDSVKAVETLLENGASINAETENQRATPLHLACNSGNLKIATLLVENGANVETKNDMDFTALHCASDSCHPKIVEMLLTQGKAQIEATTAFSSTALYLAVKRGSMETANTLLKHGASPVATNSDGFTMLHAAAQSGVPAIVGRFVKKSVQPKDKTTSSSAGTPNNNLNQTITEIDVNVKTNNGFTPLHTACQSGCVDVAAFLLDQGADIEAKTEKFDRTPVDIAYKWNQLPCVKLLVQRGARRPETW